MGSWGYSPLQNDTSHDVIHTFEDKLKKGISLNQATSEILEEFHEDLNDIDTAGDVWLALAERHWQYCHKDKVVEEKLNEICINEWGQELWKQEGPSEYQKRLKALNKFYSKVTIPKVTPKKFPKTVIRKPLFNIGDCLAVDIGNGHYAACLVLGSDHSNPEVGTNLIVTLDYYSTEKPTLKIFTERPYLHLTHGNWKGQIDVSNYVPAGHRKMKNKISLIGNIDVSKKKIPECSSFSGYIHLGKHAEYQTKNR